MSAQSAIPDLTIKQLLGLKTLSPLIGNFPERLLSTTYEDFIAILYKEIDRAIVIMQESAELLTADGEDRLTVDLRGKLVMLGYEATHDQKIRGHTDLVVRAPYGDYVWIGEAKIYDGPEIVMKGFKQLCTRYSSGDPTGTHGGMLIYIRDADATRVMTGWKGRLQTEALPEAVFNECPQRTGLCFFSNHKHPTSGLTYTVRHMPVILHFDPKDKK